MVHVHVHAHVNTYNIIHAATVAAARLRAELHAMIAARAHARELRPS